MSNSLVLQRQFKYDLAFKDPGSAWRSQRAKPWENKVSLQGYRFIYSQLLPAEAIHRGLWA